MEKYINFIHELCSCIRLTMRTKYSLALLLLAHSGLADNNFLTGGDWRHTLSNSFWEKKKGVVIFYRVTRYRVELLRTDVTIVFMRKFCHK